MTATSSRKTWISVVVAAAIVLVVLLVVIIGSATVFFSRHVKTEHMASDAAAIQFETARAHLAGQSALIEYEGFYKTPIVRRNASAPRHQLRALHVLAYDVGANQLRHVDIPGGVLQVMTVGGRLRLWDLDALGDNRDRITLDDLQQHGPGLVLDEHVGPSRLLVWTE